MSWIDRGSWNGHCGRQLVNLLANEYTSDVAMIKLLDDADIDRGNLPGNMPLRLRWHELAHSLQSAGLLGRLLVIVGDDFPALKEKLSELNQEDPAQNNGPGDRYEAQLVGPGRRPLIDRADLRDKLRRFIDNPFPVLVVRGEARCGKSFSFELIKHVIAHGDDSKLVWVDFSPAACGNSATALMAMICSRLGLPDVTDQPRTTTPKRYAGELVDDLVGIYEFKDKAPRIIVVDGLNRPGLQSDVYDLVIKLSADVINQQLPRTQLVLTGYSGEFDRQLRYDILTEDVVPITETHVRLYFDQLVPARPLTPEQVNDLVRQAMAAAGDLEALEDRVRELALPLVDAR